MAAKKISLKQSHKELSPHLLQINLNSQMGWGQGSRSGLWRQETHRSLEADLYLPFSSATSI